MRASRTSRWPPAARCASRPRCSASTPGERRPLEELPGWLADLARFRHVHVSGGDPIAFWLTTPLLGFEPPAVAVRRYWRAIAAVADETLTVVAAHSGPMRALVAHAFARDLGEPDNLEAVAIHLERPRARRRSAARRAEIAVPDSTSPLVVTRSPPGTPARDLALRS